MSDKQSTVSSKSRKSAQSSVYKQQLAELELRELKRRFELERKQKEIEFEIEENKLKCEIERCEIERSEVESTSDNEISIHLPIKNKDERTQQDVTTAEWVYKHDNNGIIYYKFHKYNQKTTPKYHTC
ncbi:hypothetical protein ACF0H5_006903 [Mactra antiquata]